MKRIFKFIAVFVFMWMPSLSFSEELTGVLLGEKEILVKSRAQGQISAVQVEEGSLVKTGDLLAQLDDKQEKIERDLASVESNIASQDYQKTKQLKKYVSEEEISNKQNNYLKKKSTHDLKELSLANKKITAPIDGIVTERFIKSGETVSMGEKVFKIVQLENLIIETHAEAKDVSKFSIGQEVQFVTELYKEEIFSAKISYISPVVDASSGTVKIRALLKNKQLPDKTYQLKPGILVTIRMGKEGKL